MKITELDLTKKFRRLWWDDELYIDESQSWFKTLKIEDIYADDWEYFSEKPFRAPVTTTCTIQFGKTTIYIQYNEHTQLVEKVWTK